MSRGKLEAGAFRGSSSATRLKHPQRGQTALNQFAKKPKPPAGWWNKKIKQGLSPSAVGRIWYHIYNDERRQLAIQKYAGEDVTNKERAYRVKTLKKRIEKIRSEYDDLSKNPRTFSYDVAFGNPGGCVSKSLRNRIDRWHEKLRNLSNEEGKLKTHVLILEGSPLTDKAKRDYLYYTRWGTAYKREELDAKFNRAIKDAPQYVQRAYQDNYHRQSAKPKAKPQEIRVQVQTPSPSSLKNIESLKPQKLTDEQLIKRYGQLKATKRDYVQGRLSNEYYRRVVDPGGVTGKVPKDVFLFTNLDPTISDFEKEIKKRNLTRFSIILTQKTQKPQAKPKKQRLGGRGRTHTGMAVNLFLLESLKSGTIMQTIRKFEYKQGVAREEELFKKLRKEGLTDKDIKKHLGELIREGEVYSPRPSFYRRTSYRPRKRKRQNPAKMSWIDSVIKDTERELKRIRRGSSKKERALLRELGVVELYIKNAPLAQKRRAMKSRDFIIAQLRKVRKS